MMVASLINILKGFKGRIIVPFGRRVINIKSCSLLRGDYPPLDPQLLRTLLKTYTKTRNTIIYILIISFATPPLSLFATGIEVDHTAPASERALLDQTQNGTDIVNMSRPSGAGISKNTFREYNVSNKGVVLNNSTGVGVSQLGGALYGNPYYEGRSADLILFEVSGTNRSNLDGYTEVFGQSADFILANQNGIAINGGGFINTPRAILTTGKPFLDSNGNVSHIDVESGEIIINQLGLDASTTDYFDIVSRVARINGELWGGKNLRVQVGQNRFDYVSRMVGNNPNANTTLEKPEWGIDASALGVVRAGRITLIGTEDGVGVKSDGELLSLEDVNLTVEGDIEYNVIRTNGNVGISSKGSVTQKGETVSDKKIHVQAKENITLKGIKTEGKQGIVLNSGQNITIGASSTDSKSTDRKLTPQLYSPKDVIITAEGNIENRLGYIESDQSIRLTAKDNQINNNGVIASLGRLDITAKSVNNKTNAQMG
jgi:filamentous hemagglutinin